MTGVDQIDNTTKEEQPSLPHDQSQITTTTTSTAFGSSPSTQQEQVEGDPEYHHHQSSFVEAEWDPVEFDLKKSSNPNWKNYKNVGRKSKPKRIQDIRLRRLDSEGSNSSAGSGRHTPEQNDNSINNNSNCSYFDDWPYEAEGNSPCAMFGKTAVASSPAEGFEGEFSAGDPEWDNNDGHSSRRSSGSRERSRRKAKQQIQKQEEEYEDDDENDDPGSDDDNSGSYNSDYGGSQSGGSDEQSSDSERSASDSGHYEDDNLMVTPAMGKAREARKKPPTLKRGAHQVATPSIVKALKGKQAFSSDDEGDNGKINFDDFDSDLDSGGSGHSRSSRRSSRDNGAAKSKRESRLEAASATFRRPSSSKKPSNFTFDRSMSSADLKAARKANNSFKGQVDMNKSFGALARAQRQGKEGQSSFGNSSHSKRGARSPLPEKSLRKTPGRAKSMGNPTTGGSKLKSALSKFAGTADSATTSTSDKPKTYGATLSALKVLSGADPGTSGGGESDLKAAIMRQVHRSTSGLNAMELPRKPKPKITKTLSLSEAGMRGAGVGGDALGTGKEAPPKIRRARTSNERAQASFSEFNASYHENMAKMRRQKMADASERSMKSAESLASQESNKDSTPGSHRPSNLDRRAKSFSHSRSGATLDNSVGSTSPDKTPPPKRGLQRGNSKRLSSDTGAALDGEGSRHSSRRSLQKSGSRRRIQQRPEYDASPQAPTGATVIALLKQQKPVTDKELKQKGNRQMFHALMYKTRMGIDMDKLRRKVEGCESSESEEQGEDSVSGESSEEEED